MRVAPHSQLVPPPTRPALARTFVLFALSCLWNLAAPFKAWELSRYGFLPTSNTVVLNLEWDTVLNGRLLSQLYAAAGIPLSRPLNATRYLNVFLDFVVTPRSVGRWATAFVNSADVSQMSINGRPRRRSLNASRERALFERDIHRFESSGFLLWGTEVLFDVLPPVADGTAVQDVAEAVLCLKGVSADAFVNLQYPSKLDPLKNPSDAAAVAVWADIMFPDLAACLVRRNELLAAAPTPAAGVVALAEELAATFNLSLVNIAGTEYLYSPTTFLEGFLDISGQRAGQLTYQIMGRDPAVVYMVGSGNLDSILVARETAWWCSIQYIDPATGAPNATKCFTQVATTLPAFFLAKYTHIYAGTRYVDASAVAVSGSLGNLTTHAWRPQAIAPLDTIREIEVAGSQRTFRLFWQAAIAEAGGAVDADAALEELCLVDDGCVSGCRNESASGGTTLAFRRGGACVSAPNAVAYDANRIFTDRRCLGAGGSLVQITYLDSRGNRRNVTLRGTGRALGVLACIIGGRPPNTDFPSYLYDILSQDTQATIATTVVNGSETIVLNFISLVSLFGDIFFFVCVCAYLRTAPTWLHHPQVAFSRTSCGVGAIVWARHRTVLVLVNSLSLLAWHIGAARTTCAWDATAATTVSVDPTYTCTVVPWGHLSSVAEGVRLFSMTWTFFAIAFLDRMPGITRHWRAYATAVGLLGFIPLTLGAAAIAYASQLRPVLLPAVHSQFVLLVLWCGYVVLLRSRLAAPYVMWAEDCIQRVGFAKQSIAPNSAFRTVVGAVYWTSANLRTEAPATYVPLSLLLKTPGIAVNQIRDHEYILGPAVAARKHPEWVATASEYYVCAGK
ncbi:hypothetical protein ACHHYP_07725 [Achlya hypogyna]|uniref:Transmembrane protein n=1 Tax=Achlya hypogyna TaxID=1202772 RepID=A0A1V9YQG7_ACHHY|nr:hypothetical protein ACHHYP_07725 [Achlya hypogyna]